MREILGFIIFSVVLVTSTYFMYIDVNYTPFEEYVIVITIFVLMGIGVYLMRRLLN